MLTLFDQKQPTPFASDTVLKEAKPATQRAQPSTLSSFALKFLQIYEKELQLNQSAESTFKVSDVLASIAHVYERIRNVVEYKGEHVLRRNAIERIIKRLLWERSSHDTQRIAKVLVRELIWARYLPNDSVPKSVVKNVAQTLSKYLYFHNRLQEKGVGIPDNKLKDWIWGVASCEIEETLDPSKREPYVMLMYDWFQRYFLWQENLSDHEKQIQVYLAIHRALAKSDDQIMRYHLLIKEFPQWQNASQETIDKAVGIFFKIYQEIEKHLSFPDRLKLYRVIKKHSAPFEIFRDLVNQEGQSIRTTLQSVEKFEWRVKEICQGKYAQIQKKVSRGIIRSIIYIFVTKVIFALLIEIPYEMYRLGHLTIIPLAINIVVPPASMLLIGLTIRAPDETNTLRILSKLKTIVYDNPQPTKITISLSGKKRGSFLADIFTIIYLILFLFVFGGITYVLLQFNFTFVGIGVFFAFLSLVLLFGYRVRFTASELKVTTDKEGIFSYVFSNLTLPLLRAGVWLSQGIAKLNFFTVIFDFLIEAPLKTIIEVIEEWTSFIREKREEVVEVPEQ